MTGLVDQALLARAVNHAAVHQVLYKPVEPKSWITVLEGLIQHIKTKEGVWFGTLEDAATWVREQAGL